jgi:DNA-binding GntR family transcriptional regulator
VTDQNSTASAAALILPNTRTEAITEELRRLIQSGEIAPGTRLRQAEIATRFGVSTTPVREAFTALAREGVLRQDAHRGVVVFEPKIADIHENYEIRGVLEPLAAGFAAANLSDTQLDELEGLLGLMRGETDLRRYQDLNREFHARIYAGSGRARLAALIESLRDASEGHLRYLGAHTNPASEYQQRVHAEHEGIAAALRKRNARSASKLVAEHLRHNHAQIEKVINEA